MEDSLSLTVLTKLIAVIVFAEKIVRRFLHCKGASHFVRSFCTVKAPHIFWQKNGSVFTLNIFENLMSCKLTSSLVLNNWALEFLIFVF